MTIGGRHAVKESSNGALDWGRDREEQTSLNVRKIADFSRVIK
jgi:hypothetical protein